MASGSVVELVRVMRNDPDSSPPRRRRSRARSSRKASLRAVGLEAVELDDEPGVGPEAVDLEALFADGEPGVQARARHAVGARNGRKSSSSGLRAGRRGLPPGVRGMLADGRGAAPARVAIEQVRQREPVVEPRGIPPPGARSRPLASPCPRRGRERIRADGGHRDPVPDRHLVGGKGTASGGGSRVASGSSAVTVTCDSARSE